MPHHPPPQLDLFPTPCQVVPLDPRKAIGPHTRVARVFRVRYEGELRVHQILVDRHGWYCSEHGLDCGAVAAARAAATETGLAD